MVLQRVAGRCCSGGHSQFAVDRAHMEVDGDDTDDEPLGNLRTGQALCEETQHLHLTRGEPRMKWGKRHDRCRRWGSESRLWERFQAGEDVLRWHCSPFGPGSVKCLISQLRTHGSDDELMHSLRYGG